MTWVALEQPTVTSWSRWYKQSSVWEQSWENMALFQPLAALREPLGCGWQGTGAGCKYQWAGMASEVPLAAVWVF